MKSSDKKIFVAIINNQDSTPDYFTKCLNAMINYTVKAGYSVNVEKVKDCHIDRMRNKAVKLAMDGGYDYLMQLDVDQMFPEDVLVRFLEHDKDVVTGVTYERRPPYLPLLFKEFRGIGFKDKDNRVFPEESGLIEIFAANPHCMLIKRHVLEKIKYPWYETIYLNENAWRSSDIDFCAKLEGKGFKVFLDQEVEFPHECKSLFASKNGIIFLE